VLERDEELLELDRRLKNALSEKREVDALRTCVIELQTVLKEALKAGSWKQCRQILYHESLRYVPTAATHGKAEGGKGAKGLKAVALSKVDEGVPQPKARDGKLLDGNSISKLLAMKDAGGGAEGGGMPPGSDGGAPAMLAWNEAAPTGSHPSFT